MNTQFADTTSVRVKTLSAVSLPENPKIMELLNKQTGWNNRMADCIAIDACPRCENSQLLTMSGICKGHDVQKSYKPLVCSCCGYRVDLPLSLLE